MQPHQCLHLGSDAIYTIIIQFFSHFNLLYLGTIMNIQDAECYWFIGLTTSCCSKKLYLMLPWNICGHNVLWSRFNTNVKWSTILCIQWPGLLENELTRYTEKKWADSNLLKETTNHQGQVTDNNKNNNLQMKSSICIAYRNFIYPNRIALMSTVQQQTCHCWHINQ